MTIQGEDEAPLDSEQTERKQKVDRIFQRFDVNGDGRLNRNEMAALVIAVNPRVKFSEEQISAILDEVFRTYGAYIEGEKGLSLDGLIRTYDDGAGDVDRDFIALNLVLETEEDASAEAYRNPGEGPIAEEEEVRWEALSPPATSPRLASITDETTKFQRRKENVGAWASSPTNGIVYDETWKLVEDFELYLRRVDNKIEGKKRVREVKSFRNAGVEAGEWSKELGTGSPREDQGELVGRKAEDVGSDSVHFKKSLADFRNKADALRSRGDLQAYDAHMAIGRTLSDHRWYADASTFFQRAIELRPEDPRANFRYGNAQYSCGKLSEARAAYEKALEALHKSGSSSSLRPQVHVNLGIVLEAEGMLFGACYHYREAAILNSTHYRALKLLGSALLGAGEYHAAEKALEEAIFLKDDYADAHCDLGSALVALGEHERATTEFQRAIDLKPDHVDALYNLGGLLRDNGKYSNAADLYSKVLELRPRDWRAQLNRAVSLLGAGDNEAARKALKDAFKTTNRVEVYDAIMHLKNLQKKPKGLASLVQKTQAQDGLLSDANGRAALIPDGYVTIEMGKFHRATEPTSSRLWLGYALEIRRFQKHTRLHKFNASSLKVELDNNADKSGDVGASAYLIKKPDLEVITRRLLHFLSPEAFQASMKAINEKILSVLDRSLTGRVDLRMFLASITPLCATLTAEKRKYLVFRTLSWRHRIEGQISKTDAKTYIKFMRAMFLPSQGTSDMWELHGDDDNSDISYTEFVYMFDDLDWGFGILTLLVKLEAGDHVRHQGLSCAVCAYPIIGPRFKEVKANFNLCSSCYSDGKVPSSIKQDAYYFKEYGSDTLEWVKERFKFLGLKGSPSSKSVDLTLSSA